MSSVSAAARADRTARGVVSLSEHRLHRARARIAEAMLANAGPEHLGRIRLRPHQQLAIVRITRAVERHGGCLLAEDVGRGKTYVALAVLRTWAKPLVVVPASLRATWHRAMILAGVSAPIVTHESLSRGTMPGFEPDGVVVDESHRFRSTHVTSRISLADWGSSSRVLRR